MEKITVTKKDGTTYKRLPYRASEKIIQKYNVFYHWLMAQGVTKFTARSYVVSLEFPHYKVHKTAKKWFKKMTGYEFQVDTPSSSCRVHVDSKVGSSLSIEREDDTDIDLSSLFDKSKATGQPKRNSQLTEESAIRKINAFLTKLNDNRSKAKGLSLVGQFDWDTYRVDYIEKTAWRKGQQLPTFKYSDGIVIHYPFFFEDCQFVNSLVSMVYPTVLWRVSFQVNEDIGKIQLWIKIKGRPKNKGSNDDVVLGTNKYTYLADSNTWSLDEDEVQTVDLSNSPFGKLSITNVRTSNGSLSLDDEGKLRFDADTCTEESKELDHSDIVEEKTDEDEVLERIQSILSLPVSLKLKLQYIEQYAKDTRMYYISRGKLVKDQEN